ncbi:MAG TPA: amino acid adenylation domain-containing protein [Mycobacteriales bacterium]|nr:amino acid adenylation domain-containing protein [Mycobacteriales bacterium]
MTTTYEPGRQSVLAQSVREIRRLRSELAAAERAERARTEPVAIVGMACRLPGDCTDPESYWELLSQGRDGITDIPASRWDVEHYYDPSPAAAGKMYARRGGFLADIDRFDAAFFGISPREAATLDPQQRLLLEVGWQALEDAAQGPDELLGSPTGVFFGVTNYDYCQLQMQQVAPGDLEAYSLTSNASTFAAGRLSYWLGLTGPSLSVDTACSSSLVGVHLACQSLRSGESSMALAGGVNVLLSPEWSVVLSRAKMLAPDGRCKTFDASADGYVRSEGCGVVVLKRLSDAVAHGDRVLALIRGSAVNQDGRSGGITVPNPSAQRDVLRSALRAAGVGPSQVSYVEAHGTGTPLGDPIEMRALHAVLGERNGSGPLLVGSVKTNIGHLEPAAGVAGLIKVVLGLRHEQIPPHLHLTEVNPEIPLEEMGMQVPTGLTPWPRGEQPRVAGVSSFGASGTNAHLVVQEAPDPDRAATGTAGAAERTAHILTLSARTPAALTALAGRYRDRLGELTDQEAPSDQDTCVELADVCFTANVGRARFAHRLAVVGSTPGQMRDLLGAAVAGESPAGVWRGQAPAGGPGGVVFLFTGQGAQYPGMAATLHRTEPAFRETLEGCDRVAEPLLGRSLLSILDPAPGEADLIHQTRYTQPALFAVEYALAQLWRSWGVEPAAVLGHSVGELAAACVAGMMPVEDGLRLAARRGQLMHDLGDGGAMAAVFAGVDRVERALAPFAAEVSVAAVNGPASVVVSGATEAVEQVLAALAAEGIRSRPVAVTRAFHSPLMDPMLDRFEAEAATVPFGPAQIPLISNVTGRPLAGPEKMTGRYLRDHVRRPVRFFDGMTTLFDQGHRTFLEVGPAPTLLGMAKRFAPDTGDRPAVFLPSLRPRRDDWQVLCDSLAALHARGVAVDWARFDAGRARRRVALPGYPFQRDRHWFQASATVPPAPVAVPAEPTGPPTDSLLGRRIDSPLEVIQFEARLDAQAHPCLGDCVMDGLPVVNIGVYLEAALSAARELNGPGPVLITDAVVRQSLVLEADQTPRAHLAVTPGPDGSASYRYHAEHRDATGGSRWVLHSQGVMRPAGEDRQPWGDPATAGLDRETSGEDFYRQMWQRRLYLGPSARWVERVWSGTGRAVARMRLPEPGEADRYLLHPGITDAMFQVLFACLPTDGADATYLLVSIDRFVFHGYDSGQPLYCQVRLLPESVPGSTLVAEVRLGDGAGRPVAEAGGVHLRRAERAALSRPGSPRSQSARAATAVGRSGADPAPVPAGASIHPTAEQIRRADPAGRATAVRALLVRLVARALGAAEADLDTEESLHNLGLDSLMALEVKESVAAALGVNLPLVSLLEGCTITRLGADVLGLLGLADAGPGGAPDGPATSADPADPDGPDGLGLPVLVPDPDARYEPFSLTDLQQAYLVGRSGAFELGNTSTYFLIEVDLDGVDLPRLASALRRMIDRHDMLRAVVSADGYQRVLAEVPEYQIATVDLTGLAEPERARRLAEIHREMAGQVFDTTAWPLFDIRATRIDPRRTRLHVGLDALIIDAWSTSLLFREWAAAYRDQAAEPAELPIGYRDYVLAARSLEGGPQHRRSQRYWQDRLPGLPAAPELPLARNPATLASPTFTHRSSRLEPADWERFKHRAAEAGVTPSVALCTAYAQVLGAWSRSGHFTLNVLFFNRLPLHPRVGDVLGNFSATTLLEVDGTGTEGFAERANRVQKRLWTDLEHSHVSGVRVLREMNRARGGSARATMPVVFASTVNFAARDDSASATGLAQHLIAMGESGREVSSSIRTPQVWLDHQVVEDAGALIVNWDVLEEIFPAGMIDAMFGAYLGLLGDLCADQRAWREPVPVLVPVADLDARRAVNATDAPVPGGLLHDGFVARAATHPDVPAVIAADRTLSYGELDRRSNRVGRWLRAHNVGPGTLVAVVMDKGWEQVVAALGVLKAGGAYVPIDAAVPPERLRLLLASAGISVAVTQAAVRARIEWPRGTELLAVDGAEGSDGSDAGDDGPLPPGGAAPDDLAYVIFTSGSTGQPKGVMIEHAAALNTVADVNERFGITENDRVLALSALNFDLSVYDIFGLLSAGGAVVIPEPTAHREPARWAALVAEHRVTVWNTVPTLMEMFTEHALADPAAARPPLRVVMMSGDWIPVTLPERIGRLVPDAAVWSLGGATEASIWSILYPIGRVDPDWASIPYGTPMRNQRFHVLDEAFAPCPVWVPGQLYIAGVGLARGYLNDEVRTRASFVRHPATGERLYRTGDLGRYLPDGNIEFLGREDFQVKVGGYRIELGEIETALSQCSGVRAAVVTAAGERHGAKRLIGYVVGDPDAGPGIGADPDRAEAELLGALRRTLPDYLVPQRIVVLDALPLSANGKVDRSALPAPDRLAGDPTGNVLPRDQVETDLAGIWAEFFDARPIGVDANFFDLGGDSLLAVRLMARIQAGLGRDLPLSTLFTHPTVGLLAEVLRESGTGPAAVDRRTALVPVRTVPAGTAADVPLFFVHPIGGDVLCYAELAGLLGDRQPFYGLQVPDDAGELDTVPALARHYAEAITATVPDGPYRLGGWSMGGVVALEIARQLDLAGRTVELLALVDLLEPPGPAEPVDEPVLLSWFARDLAGLAGRRWAPAAHTFAARDGRTGLEILHERAGHAGVLPPEVDVDTLGRIVARVSRNFRALLAHRPAPYSGRVRFFRGANGGASARTAREWMSLFSGDARILDVPGDHYSLMRSPRARALATGLRTALDQCGPVRSERPDPSDPGDERTAPPESG